MKPATILLPCLLAFLSASAPAATEAPPAKAPLDTASFVRLMNAERWLNVGKPLPAGIRVVDADAKPLDLRAALHGPVALVRVEAHCAPCKSLLDYVRAHADEYARTQHATIVVLQTGDSGHASLSLPKGVPELHAGDSFDKGFLASHITPTVYFFDAGQTLLARRSGLTTPENFLRFPAHP